MTFKHLVGKSTLKEGITIHKNFEAFFESPASGQKREMTLIYDDNKSCKVVLRRLNNIRNHVQIKYTKGSERCFFTWLLQPDVSPDGKTTALVSEFHKISQ